MQKPGSPVKWEGNVCGGPKGEAFLRLFKYLQPPCGHKSPSSCLFTNANQRACTFLILTTSLELW